MKIPIRERRLRWLGLKLGLVVGFSGAAGLVLPEAVLAEQPSPSSTIRVRVNNYSRASDRVLASAEHEANRIFGRAGLAVDWLNCPPGHSNPVQPDSCHEAPGPTDIILRVLSAPARTKFQDSVFGFAVYPHLASVFYDRMLKRAISDDAEFEAQFLLGCAIAHEIGHLLLGSNGHSGSGVMRARWERKQIRQAMTGALLFTPEQARLIQAEAQTRTQTRLQAAGLKEYRKMMVDHRAEPASDSTE
jgi:hypothetical protein